MVKVSTLLGGEANSTRHQMEEVFQLEKKLAQIYEPKERLRDMEKIYHKMTVAELQQLAPAVSETGFLLTVPRLEHHFMLTSLSRLGVFSYLRSPRKVVKKVG